MYVGYISKDIINLQEFQNDGMKWRDKCTVVNCSWPMNLRKYKNPHYPVYYILYVSKTPKCLPLHNGQFLEITWLGVIDKL